jgi:hypothetical protein
MIKMTAIWIAGLCGLLSLCLGALMGTSWADQALDQRYRRLAIERRELDEWRHTLQNTSLRCALCGNPTILSTGDRSGVGGRINAATRR